MATQIPAEGPTYRVLAALDLGDASAPVLDRALELADLHPASEVHAVTVVEPHLEIMPRSQTAGQEALARLGELATEAARRFEQARGEARGAVRVRKIVTHVLLGSPAAEIGWLSDWLDVDFLVVGTHGRRGPARLLLGSVASSVVKQARCPVLVERPKAHPESAKEPRIEPPCPACLEVREASGGEQMWCARHSMHHPHAHVYSFSDRFGPESRPWGFHP